MNSGLLVSTVVLLFFFILILITNYLYRHYKWSSEKSRKFIHVSGGILCLSGLPFIKSQWYVLAVCSIAFIILLVTFLKKSMPSVHETTRVSYGSVLFPIPIYFCFLASHYENDQLFFFLPVSLLSFSDTLAEWGGNKWGHYTLSFFERQKTLAGSICFGISAFVICFILLFYLTSFSLWLIAGYSLLLMLITTVIELLTLKGFDNISVPISAILILHWIL